MDFIPADAVIVFGWVTVTLLAGGIVFRVVNSGAVRRLVRGHHLRHT